MTQSRGTPAFVVSSGHALIVVEGVADSGLVYGGGMVTIGPRATVTNTLVSSGGFEVVSGESVPNAAGTGLEQIGGLDIDGLILSGAEQLVSNGVSSDTTIDEGTQIVEGTVNTSLNLEGFSISAQISGGLEQVGNLGFASNTDAYSGALIEVLSGGMVDSAIVHSGGILLLQDGTASGSTIESGGTLIVDLGLSAELQAATTVDPGATVISTGVVQIIPELAAQVGFIPYSYTVSSYQTVALNLRDYAETVIDVLSGGILSATAVENLGSATVMHGGFGLSNTIFAQGTLGVEIGGSVSHTTIYSSGLEVLSGVGETTQADGGLDVGAIISGGTQLVEGFADSAAVYVGGVQSVTNFGLASGTVLYNSGVLSADNDGLVYSAVISSGGLLIAGYAAFAHYTTISSAGAEIVENQASEVGGTVSNGGVMAVDAGGFTLDNVILSGGFKFVSSGGFAQTDTISSGATEVVESGGSISGAELLSGGTLLVYGTASDVAQDGGSETYITDSLVIGTGQSISSVAFSASTVGVSSGGTVSHVTVLGGSNLSVFYGGFALDDLVLGTPDVTGGGATQTISSGGMASGTDIQQAGDEEILSGGIASSSEIESAGTQGVNSAGSAYAASVMSGGVQYVEDDGTAFGTTVQFGATQDVGAGGTASGTTVDSGAVQYLDSPVAFIGLLQGGLAYSATILDGGLQQVSSGAVADYTSLGSAIQVDQGVTTGTVIGSGGIVSAGGVSGEGTTSDTQILFGGTELLQYGAKATDTVVSSGGTQVIDPGAVAYGTTVLAGGMQVLEGGAVSGGSVAAGGSQVLNDATLSGTVSYALGAVVIDSAGFVAKDATITVAGTLENDALAELDPSSMTVSSLIGSGIVQIDSGSFLEIVGSASADQTITFTASSGEVKIDQLTDMHALVSGFTSGDTIDLAAIAYDPVGSVGPVTADDVLPVFEGGNSYELGLLGDYAGDTFQLAPDASSGTLLTVEVPCFLAGTRILTPQGEVPVERLAIGDMIVTASGQNRPVRWMGIRSYAGRFLAASPHVQPIRFRAGSLGDALPRRDLLVSPDHAMVLDGQLVPARCLVNGKTIVQERGLNRVDYFHVELDSHDVLLAEGAPSESYLDDESRGMFRNAAEFAALYPDAPEPGRFCAPRVTDGYRLEAIRKRLAVASGEMMQTA